MNHKNLDILTEIIHNWAPHLLTYFGLGNVRMKWTPYSHLMIDFKNIYKNILTNEKHCIVTTSGDLIEGRRKHIIGTLYKTAYAIIFETTDNKLAIKHYRDINSVEVIYLTKQDPILDFDAIAQTKPNKYCYLKNLLKQDLFAHYISYCRLHGIKNQKLCSSLGAKTSNKNSVVQKNRALKRKTTRWYDIYISSSKGIDNKQLCGVDTHKLAKTWGFKGCLNTFHKILSKGIWEADNANSYIKITVLLKGQSP